MTEVANQHESTLSAAVDSIRGLAQLALEKNDPQMLVLLSHVGSMATHLNQYGEALAAEMPSVEIPAVPKLAASVVDLAEHRPAAVAETPETDEGLVDEHLPAAESVTPDTLDIEQAAETFAEEIAEVADDLLARITHDLNLRPRHIKMLQGLMRNGDKWVASSTVIKGIEGSTGSNRQALRALTRLINSSAYESRLSTKGVRAGFRYMWHSQSSDVDTGQQHTPSLGSASPSSMPQRRQEHPVAPPAYDDDESEDIEASQAVVDDGSVRLAALGIEAHLNGTNHASINRIYLDLKPMETELFLFVAEQQRGVLFSDIMDRFNPGKDNQITRDLNAALANIPNALNEFEIDWLDYGFTERGPIGNAVKRRFVGLSVDEKLRPKQTEGRDFLDRRPPLSLTTI